MILFSCIKGVNIFWSVYVLSPIEFHVFLFFFCYFKSLVLRVRLISQWDTALCMHLFAFIRRRGKHLINITNLDAFMYFYQNNCSLTSYKYFFLLNYINSNQALFILLLSFFFQKFTWEKIHLFALEVFLFFSREGKVVLNGKKSLLNI